MGGVLDADAAALCEWGGVVVGAPPEVLDVVRNSMVQIIRNLEAENEGLHRNLAHQRQGLAHLRSTGAGRRASNLNHLLRSCRDDWFAAIEEIISELRTDNIALHASHLQQYRGTEKQGWSATQADNAVNACGQNNSQATEIVEGSSDVQVNNAVRARGQNNSQGDGAVKSQMAEHNNRMKSEYNNRITSAVNETMMNLLNKLQYENKELKYLLYEDPLVQMLRGPCTE